MIIDAHMHLIRKENFDKERYQWLDNWRPFGRDTGPYRKSPHRIQRDKQTLRMAAADGGRDRGHHVTHCRTAVRTGGLVKWTPVAERLLADVRTLACVSMLITYLRS